MAVLLHFPNGVFKTKVSNQGIVKLGYECVFIIWKVNILQYGHQICALYLAWCRPDVFS
jgi:hypothetical protein